MSKRERVVATQARPDAGDVELRKERVSLHGPSFEEVLVGLLKVKPKSLDTEDEEGDEDDLY